MAHKEKESDEEKLKSDPEDFFQNLLKFSLSRRLPSSLWPKEFSLFDRDRLSPLSPFKSPHSP
jgi:hypothetical protein